MKKLFTLLICLTGIVSLYSCLSESSNEIHQSYFYPTNVQGIALYADQEKDTTLIYSYDSWTASVYTPSGSQWLTITPNSLTIPDGYCMGQKLDLITTPNTTGLSRYAAIHVDVSSTEIGTLSMPVYQYGWLDITVPEPVYSSNDLDTATATFADELAASATQAYLVYTTFGETTVSSDADWLQVPQDMMHVPAGYHSQILTVTPNTSLESRVANITITSNGISNTVTYTQKGKE